MDDIGAAIKSLRTLAGMSQGDLGQRIWTNTWVVHRIETGLQAPTAEQIERLAEILEAPALLRSWCSEHCPACRERLGGPP